MTERAPWLSAERVGWLGLSFALVALPHALRLPPWVTAVFFVCLLWRLAAAFRDTPLPGVAVRLLMQAALLAGVYLEYGRLFGRTPGIALLVALAGLKLLESRSRRDALVAVLLAYFLVVTNFLFSQSIPTGLFMVLAVVVTTATLIRLTVPPGDLDQLRSLRLAGSLLAQALPLMVVLFLFFPRISGPLWGLPEDAHSGVTGLSESMSPGSISALGQSDAVAFRVQFEGEPPPPEELYWRGPVLWDTDGRTWTAGRFPNSQPPLLDTGPGRAEYTVTLEPHDHRWLFLLDVPTELPRTAALSHDLIALAERPVRERRRYRAASATRYEVLEITPEQRSRALALAPDAHPQARALARRWRAQADDARAVVARALEHFATGGYGYTLTPPLLPGDPVDQFLFESRLGFCEHYAGAFTVLMRAAGVPARVVTGYQGGERNPLDDFWMVRQREAHAWSEVWYEDRGWVRVDPTGAVAPLRVAEGMQGALPQATEPLIGLGADNSERVYRLLRQLRFGWDAVNNWWHQWVLGFGPQRQRDLLSWLGLDGADWRQLGVVLAGASLVVLAGVALWLRRRAGHLPDRTRRLYDRFCRRLAARGLPREPAEGPRDYARRAARRFPAAATDIQGFTEDYVRLRYGDGSGDPRDLARQVRRLRLDGPRASS